MLNEDTRIEQLDTLVRIFGNGKKAAFARRLNVSSARIGMWYTRKFIDMPIIAEALPEVSAEWLLRYKGEPVITEAPSVEDTPAVKFNDEDREIVSTSLVEENKRLREDNEALRKDNNALRAERDIMFEKLMQRV